MSYLNVSAFLPRGSGPCHHPERWQTASCFPPRVIDNFAQTNRAVFGQRFFRRQSQDQGHAPIVASDGNRFIMKYGIYEGLYFRDITLRVAFNVEVEW